MSPCGAALIQSHPKALTPIERYLTRYYMNNQYHKISIYIIRNIKVSPVAHPGTGRPHWPKDQQFF